jgi:hypothetical protein
MFGDPHHSLQSYQRALGLTPNVDAPARLPIAGPVTGSRVAGPSAAQQHRIFVQVLQQAGVATAANTPAAVRAVDLAVVPVQGIRYKSKTIKGVRMVTYDNAVQIICHSRRIQRSTVKRLNAGLRENGF